MKQGWFPLLPTSEKSLRSISMSRAVSLLMFGYRKAGMFSFLTVSLPLVLGWYLSSTLCEYLSECYYQGVHVTSICKNDYCFNNINIFGVHVYTLLILHF